MRHVHERRRLRVAERRALAPRSRHWSSDATPSAIPAASATRRSSRGRRRTTASSSPSTSQTAPHVPIRESQTNTLVERVPAVVDDPALETAVEGDQAPASRFVWSISCWRSNGFRRIPAPARCLARDARRR